MNEAITFAFASQVSSFKVSAQRGERRRQGSRQLDMDDDHSIVALDL